VRKGNWKFIEDERRVAYTTDRLREREKEGEG
jgi:hypothetical protein